MSLISRATIGVAILSVFVPMAIAGDAKDLCHGFVPENNLRVPVPTLDEKQRGLATGLDEAQFKDALDRFEATAKKLIVPKGGRLVLSRRWTDDAVNASAQQVGNLFLINMYGGLARYPSMTADGFLFVACHELGHHLGGAPKAAAMLGVKNWATNEGGSDYYAGLKCLRHLFHDEDNRSIVQGLKVSPYAAQACEANFPLTSDENMKWICMRSSVASDVLGEVMRSIMEKRDGKPIAPTSLETPDTQQVAKTFDGHPQPQCRVDTYFAGALCAAKHDEPVSDTDPLQGACADSEALVSRPRCWYKPTTVPIVSTSKNPSDVLIWFNEKADLVASQLLTDREARIDWIYKSLVKTAVRSQASAIRILESEGVSHRSYHLSNVIHVPQATEAVLNRLRQLTEVARISSNFKNDLRLPPVETAPSNLPSSELAAKGVESSIRDSGAEEVWTKLGAKGKGIVIASADSGVDWTHPAIRQQYRGQSPLFVNHDYHWHDAIHHQGKSSCAPSSKEPCDDSGHGTHTVGTMVGSDGGANQIGIAPEAKWIGCRNMNQGTGTLASYLECFEFFLTPYPTGGDPKIDGRADMAPHIVNNSWSCPTSEGCKREDLVDVVRVMKAAGIAMVVAAGNDGDTCGSLQDPPGTYSGDVISVAAYNRYRKEAAYFSSRGPSGFHGQVGIDITAHGVGIRSAVVGGKYDEKDGTSMAAPHVAGAIALLWSHKPQLISQVDQTAELLKSTAKPVKAMQSCGAFPGSAIPNTTYGHGMLDIVALLN